MPQGAKTNDEVVAVGTWKGQQDVLEPGEEREFTAVLSPLSSFDEERIAAGSAELSAMGMGAMVY